MQSRTAENNELDACIQATFQQCFMVVFDRAPHNPATASNAPLGSFKRLSLCNVELQKINELGAYLQATGYKGNFWSVFHDGV